MQEGTTSQGYRQPLKGERDKEMEAPPQGTGFPGASGRKASAYNAGDWGSIPGSGKASAYNAGDWGSIPGSGRSPGEGSGNPLEYPCRKIPWMEKPGRLQSMGSQRVGHD